jgi:hypothetical protein
MLEVRILRMLTEGRLERSTRARRPVRCARLAVLAISVARLARAAPAHLSRSRVPASSDERGDSG